MNLLVNEKINSCDFFNIFLYILKEKGINNISKNDLKYAFDYFKLFDKYQNLFNNIYPDINIDKMIEILTIIGFVRRFESNLDNIYILKGKLNDNYNNNYYLLVEELVDDYISLINSNRVFENIEISNPNNISYKILNGRNDNELVKVDLITDGNVKFSYDIESKGYCKDVHNNNVILLLQNLKMQKIILENATFAIKQSIKNDNIKNFLYTDHLDEQKLSLIYNSLESDNAKIKRLSI